MDANKTIEIILADIEEAKRQGVIGFAPDALAEYLRNLVKRINASADAEPGQIRAQHEKELAHAQSVTNLSLELLRLVGAAGQNALKNITLVNGGAAVALLAFLGTIWRADSHIPAEFAFALLAFTMGVLMAAVATGFTYLTDYAGTIVSLGKFEGTERSVARFFQVVFQWSAVVLVITAYIAFGCGAYTAVDGFLANNA